MTVREVLVNNASHKVKVLERNLDTFLIEVDEKTVKVKIKGLGQGKTATMEINGKVFQADVERVQGKVLRVKLDGKSFGVQIQPKLPQETTVRQESTTIVARKPVLGAMEKGAVTAPIAGKIVLVKAKVGQKIEKGECVCVLEAMKMQNEISAARAGVVKEIRVDEGMIVNKGDVLAVIA